MKKKSFLDNLILINKNKKKNKKFYYFRKYLCNMIFWGVIINYNKTNLQKKIKKIFY